MFLLNLIPWWGRLIALLALVAAVWGYGWLKGNAHGTEKLTEYQGAQLTATVKLANARIQIVHEVETKYQTRIQVIHETGKAIEDEANKLVTPAADAEFPVPVGFVRLYGAAWTGTPPGPPAELDRQPSGVPLSEIAGDEANNATSCLIYKAQRDGLIEVYRKLQAAR